METKRLRCTPPTTLGSALFLVGSSRRRPGVSSAGVRFALMVALNCYLPILLLWSGVIPFAYRFHVLAIVLTSCIGYSLRRGYRLRDLGFTLENGWHSLRWNGLFCILGAIGLYGAYQIGVLMPREHDYSFACFLFYIFFLAPVQEFIFRGLFFAEMQRNPFLDPKAMLLVSTISFCFLHVIYAHPPILLITFVSGLAWGVCYLRWPTLLGISFSHAVLGALAMFLGVL